MRNLVVVCAAALLAGPAPAQAATVAVKAEPSVRFPGGADIEYDAAAGEANRLTVVVETRTAVRVQDLGATIVPGSGCQSIDAHAARCATDGRPLVGADVFVGDLDDVVDIQGTLGSTLDGGGGRDVLLGGSGDDVLTDGDAPDAVGSDVMDGRGGMNTVTYATRTRPVLVDLATPASSGEAGEADVLRSVDHVIGGHGPDVLHGDDGFNRLSGSSGDDRLYGLEGSDIIDGGPGGDWLSGGPGDDRLEGGAGIDRLFGRGGNDGVDGGDDLDFLHGSAGADRLTSGIAYCGDGRDTVVPSAERDRIWRDCEWGSQSIVSDPPKAIGVMPYPTRVTGRSLTFTASCPHRYEDTLTLVYPIRGWIVLRTAGGSLIARSKIPRQCRKRAYEAFSPRIRITATLNATGRELLALAGRSEIEVGFLGRNVPANPWTFVVR